MSWLRELLSATFHHADRQIDLHGLSVPEALALLQVTLADAERDQLRVLRVVCGKGRHSPGGVGVLRGAVAGWLDAHGYAGRYRRELDRDGLDGALRVELGAGQ